MRAKLIYLLYWTLQALAFPFLLLYLALRIHRNSAYANRVSERFGFLPRPLHRTVPGAIWLHAVSVGEAITAVGLLKRLKQELPYAPIYVSCTTLAGRAMAEQKLEGLADGVFYAPIDYRFAVRRVLRSLKPSVVVVMETEIWPNLYRETCRSGARLLVINGRISDKALPKYLRFRWFFQAALSWPDAILAQDAIACSRYEQLGAIQAITAGNLKYDFDPETATIAPAIQNWLRRTDPERIWIAASTMPPAEPDDPDEDDIVLDTFQQLQERYPRLLLILVPRRPERFDEAAAKLTARGIPFQRRSKLGDAPTSVLLVDTIGELSGLFRVADVVFMGGTFPHRGGHNILEPAAFGAPVVTGPHMENFSEIATAFRAAGAVATVRDPADLALTVSKLLYNREMGEIGRQLSDERRGATARAVSAVVHAYDAALVRPTRWNPLSWLWRAGMAVDRGIKSLSLDLPTQPVISVGNLAMGGSAKTPFVLWLCQHLSKEQHHPAVLMRGYRRASSEPIVTALPSETVPVERTGEEAQLVLWSGHAAVGVGADRRAAREALAKRYPFDVVVLDDGFQSWRLHRDLDIVLIDALDPFRDGLFPGGTLREPFSALKRAGAVVITRTEPGRSYLGLNVEIRRHNQHVPIFLARSVAEAPPIPPGTTVGAFCGLGQPESFRRTLKELGLNVEFFMEFPDHHHYEEQDLQPLAMRSQVLLTTEKDLLNIDPDLARACNVTAISLRLEITDEANLLALIHKAMK
ncbi:tetraacyldisaccharide 4'-kinase [uncultured Paludibaculum sp.]|uniref:tetraacyldisaccharide 4'-kinase n=1 Tax=uncultured Paludibaculum sp. TaxID=1765020 RepID=UPI002AAA76D5|nr:tetraacyldisaccharide 4'-kinase [uncultured Paludibaculum sp.]